jgi:hypothetical protein
MTSGVPRKSRTCDQAEGILIDDPWIADKSWRVTS